jgi:hypothetical protein
VIQVNSGTPPRRYNMAAGRSAVARKSRADSRHFWRLPMSRMFFTALAAVVFAFGMVFSQPASAASLPACTLDNLWSVELIQTDFPDGFAIEYYLCMPDGWLLVGTFVCTNGNCSAD